MPTTVKLEDFITSPRFDRLATLPFSREDTVLIWDNYLAAPEYTTTLSDEEQFMFALLILAAENRLENLLNGN